MQIELKGSGKVLINGNYLQELSAFIQFLEEADHRATVYNSARSPFRRNKPEANPNPKDVT